MRTNAWFKGIGEGHRKIKIRRSNVPFRSCLSGAVQKQRNTMSKTTFLGFEQSIAELDGKIEELRFVQDDSAVDISE